MFLSWLNAQLATTPIGLVTAIYVGVGLSMFLLPPVPGIPVYLTGGIILTKAAEKEFRPQDCVLDAGKMCTDTTYFWYLQHTVDRLRRIRLLRLISRHCVVSHRVLCIWETCRL